MSKTVLCAVDISNKSRDENVLKEAARQASILDAQLDVITVVPDLGMSVVSSFFEDGHHQKLVEKTKQELNALCQAVLGDEVNNKIRHLVATGSAYEQILEVAQKDGADLILVGAHKPDLKDFLLGPNAARVVRHAQVSVFVVR